MHSFCSVRGTVTNEPSKKMATAISVGAAQKMQYGLGEYDGLEVNITNIILRSIFYHG
jgi:hypothetical protein